MSSKQKIRFRGRTYPVIGEMTVGGKRYLILQKLSSGKRQRFQAFDRLAGPRGDLRTLCILPRSPATEQHLQVLQRLSQNNPGLPTILEYHPRRNEIVVVLPWIWGQDLRTFLDRARRGRARWPSAVAAFNLYRRLAHSLKSFHGGRNMVQGDLKPDNLVLCREPNRLVMINFGSAWTVEKTIHRDLGDGYTGLYASPEQHQRRDFIDFRSDMFSASVVAYELLTGALPYDNVGGKAALPDLRTAFVDRLAPPSKSCRDKRPLASGIWAMIDRVLMKALA